MAISKLVTGNSFERPAITFSTKSADINLQKTSSLLTSKSTMADLGDSMLKLNIQLEQMQAISMEIMKSISSVLKTIAKVDRDMTVRFRILNKEMAASRTEFTRSLAYITPSLTGGAGATISAAALGPAAAASGAEAAIPSSGNSKWDAFMAFVRYAAPKLFKRLGTKFALMAALAAAPIAGWVLDAIVFVTVIADAIELYNLWCQFSNQQPQQAAIDAAQATQNKQQTPAGSPQGGATSVSDFSKLDSDSMQSSPVTGAPQGGSTTSVSEFSKLDSGASAPSLRDPTNPATQGRGGGRTPASPTDMSIGGETGAFGAAAQAANAPQPMRRPASAAPTAVTGAPIMAPPDPHAMSKAMFQQQQDMERAGDPGATAMFFAADQQRQKELAGLKAVAAAPGAPVEAKKAAAKSIQDATNPATFGRGGGHTTGETTGAIGRGGGDHTDPRMLGRGAGNHTLPTDGLPSGDTGLSDRDIRAANMQNASNMMEKKYQTEDAMGATHAKGITSTVDSNAARDAMLNMQAIDDKDRANSAATKPLEQKRVDIDAGKVEPETGHDAMGKTIRGMQGTPADQPGAPGLGDSIMKVLDSLGFGTPSGSSKAPPEATQIEPEPTAPKSEAPTVINNTQQSTTGSFSGGDQTSTPNIPLNARNPDLAPYTQPTYAFGA